MTHANAPMSETGRLRLAQVVVESGWPLRRAAERFRCSPATAKKWADRYRSRGPSGMHNLSSWPLFWPYQTPVRTERRIVTLPFTRRWGPRRIAHHLHLARSTVEKVLRRDRMPLLSHLDQATGLPVRWPKPIRMNTRFPRGPGTRGHQEIRSYRTAADTGWWAGPPEPGTRPAPKPTAGPAMPTSITQWMITPGWPTPRSTPTRRKTPPPVLAARPGVLRRARDHRSAGAHG